MHFARSFLIALLLSPAVLPAQQQNGETVDLFNGKDLTGWTAHLRDGAKMEDVFTVKDGGVLHVKGKPVGYIRTEKDYTNFVLTLEWRFPGKPGNGGVLLRQVGEDKVWPKSIEAQLQHENAGDFWNIDEFPMKVAADRTKGRNTKKAHPTNEKPPGEWNKYEITVNGGTVTLKVNDLVQNEATEAQVVPGKICIQSEGSEMELRNIRLTELPGGGGASSGGGAAADAKAVQLFNGKDLSNWDHFAADGKAKKEDVWSVKDGVIHCKGEPHGYLKTKDKYTNFVLRLDWRWPQNPGNSGVLLRAHGPDKIWPKCLEAQLMHGQAGVALPIGDFKVNAKPPAAGGNDSAERPPGEWNSYEITVNGGKAEMKVNGQVRGTATDCQVIAGTIGFQSEGSPIEFRNIELTPLPDGGAGPSASAEGGEPRRLAGLEGWHILGNGNWTLKDGVIEGKQGKEEKSYTHVVSDKSYKDFKASLKFRCLAGNSGFYFRVKPDAEGRMHGIQAEIDEANNVGGMYESYGRNWLSQPKKEDVQKYFKPQEWNEMTVEGRGPHVVVHVNGVKASEINDPTIRTEGPFALQIHGGQDVHVMFRDIKVEEVPAGGAPGATGAGAAGRSLQAAAARIYRSLTPDQREQATLPYDSPERGREVFTGGERAGVHIKNLNPDQQKLAMALLTGFTSDYGKRKAIEIADQPSNTDDPTTGFARYYLCFFGEPGDGKTYAWRIAEHHLTIVHMEVEKGEPKSFGPILLGANPPTLWDEEEEKMLALHAAMTPEERSKARAPGKGISTAKFDDRHGVRVRDLNAAAKQAAQAVLDNRLKFFAEPVAARLKQIIAGEGGLGAMRVAFYGKVDKKCRDGGRWDFKMGGNTFLCDYEGSRGHVHLSMKGTLAENTN